MTKQDGFTLLEVLLTLFILALFALPLAAIQIEVQASSSRDEFRTRAAALASEKLEELADVAYDDLAGGTETLDVRDGLAIERTWAIVDDSPIADMKAITVTVQSSDGDDSVVFTTAVRRPSDAP